MIATRLSIEALEKKTLAPYAVKSAESRGRQYKEAPDLYRTCFQRDRDRIVYSKAFRRTRGKTQVLVAEYGDHYRSRLVHSMEVAQISRAVARSLKLNEDLAEAIGLAHDLGHTPFGHAGQDVMNDLLKPYGARFEHNEQGRRIVDILEQKSPDYPGLNLSFEVRDGLLKHRTFYDHPEAGDDAMPSLEAQTANIADEIAYLNHDIDDGLRSGILSIEAFDEVALWRAAKKEVNQKTVPNLRVGLMISAVMSRMIHDLVSHTDSVLSKRGIGSVEQVMLTREPLVGFSAKMSPLVPELKTFLYRHFYHSPTVLSYNNRGQEAIRFLFRTFIEKPSLMPTSFREQLKNDPVFIVVKDYIAGMTDHYALTLYDQLQ